MTTSERTQIYRVIMGCGHVEDRRMRPATAGIPWFDGATLSSSPGAECAACRAAKFAAQQAQREAYASAVARGSAAHSRGEMRVPGFDEEFIATLPEGTASPDASREAQRLMAGWLSGWDGERVKALKVDAPTQDAYRATHSVVHLAPLPPTRVRLDDRTTRAPKSDGKARHIAATFYLEQRSGSCTPERSADVGGDEKCFRALRGMVLEGNGVDLRSATARAVPDAWYGGQQEHENSAAYVITHDEKAPGEQTEAQFKEAMRRVASMMSLLRGSREVLVVFDVPKSAGTEA